MAKGPKKKKGKKVDPSAPVKVSLPGGIRTKALHHATLAVMLSRGNITSEQAHYGQRFSDDWMLVNKGGKSAPELGVFVDNSGSGDQGSAKAIDAAARLREVQARTGDEAYTVLVLCTALGWGLKELSDKTRENDRYIGGLFRRALDEVVACYTGAQSKPSRLVRLGQAEVGAAQAAPEGMSDKKRRELVQLTRHARPPAAVQVKPAAERESEERVIFRSHNPEKDRELAARLDQAVLGQALVKIPGVHGKFRVTGTFRTKPGAGGPWFMAKGRMVVQRASAEAAQ